MRPGGKDIDTVETDGAGTVDFLPNRPGQPKRSMKATASGSPTAPRTASNRSGPSMRRRAPTNRARPLPPPMLTQSKELLATFDPKTSELARLEQKTDFRYEEGSPPRHRRPRDARTGQGSDHAGGLGAHFGPHRLGRGRPPGDESEIRRLHGRRPRRHHAPAGPESRRPPRCSPTPK